MAAKTQKALADQLGVNPGTVARYVARPDFPVKRNAPWSTADVDRIRDWRGMLQEDRARDAGAAADAAKVNMGLKLERMLHERVKRLQREGKLIERWMLVAAMVATAKLYVRSLDDLEHTLPVQLADLAGLEPAERDTLASRIEAVIRAAHRRVRQDLADRKTIELERVDLEIAAAAKPGARGRPASSR